MNDGGSSRRRIRSVHLTHPATEEEGGDHEDGDERNGSNLGEGAAAEPPAQRREVRRVAVPINSCAVPFGRPVANAAIHLASRDEPAVAV